MQASATAVSETSPQGQPSIEGRLARVFQEIFTVIVRIRTDRQSAQNADSFRAHAKRLLAMADEEARGAGYNKETVRHAVYAVVAFLDEAILNSSQPMFRDWPRRPLQEEVFGDHMAGETFFKTLSDLLEQDDSRELADLLEVYQLCLILGFRGRFASDGEGEIHRFTSRIRERMERIRGEHPPLAPSAGFPDRESVPRIRDPWVRRLAVLLVVLSLMAVGAFLLYRFLLASTGL
jgi:type VI secretion system protein ImpK